MKFIKLKAEINDLEKTLKIQSMKPKTQVTIKIKLIKQTNLKQVYLNNKEKQN